MGSANFTASASASSTTTGGNEVELRLYTTQNTAATGGAHHITTFEVIRALDDLKRYFLKGGSQLGTAGTAGEDNGVVVPISGPSHTTSTPN